MTDMTVGFLFIVIILLAFFATQITPEDSVPKRLLDERDDQIAVLQQRLLLFKDLIDQVDQDAIGSIQQRILELKREKREALEKLHQRDAILALLREELGAGPKDDLHRKVLELRAEIDRLHELLRESDTENPIARYNTLAAVDLAALLSRVRTRVKKLDEQIDIQISRKQDALQFRGDGLFAHASDEPSSAGREKMRRIAEVLGEEIGCFTVGSSAMNEVCNPNAVAIDAIQIEGHTDSDGADVYNMGLGARRGASIYSVMLSEHPSLLDFHNIQGQPVLSVASYGEGRPIADEDLEGGKDANRRIDIRFIMFAPVREEDIPLSVGDLVRVRDLLAGRTAR
ncbi:OmpA family protein [Hwanghaeella grinnelliae]|uniref:OmpA family protein n=1 Tax=Hwanghaeella grinnelliae TaxID=2500179 RepID=A0A437QHE0_9PROT|nr:OmpA family protein [Hwanghaeella grinnelliae]RVU33942.1 OmpA family protein [Hwanghaeella grinnelliae]